MRPRFSVRVLLVIVALLAMACYVGLVRPTKMAERFVAAVKQRDFTAAQSLLRQPDAGLTRKLFELNSIKLDSRQIHFVYAEVLPREWRDLWSFQRRVIFRVGFRDDSNGRHIEWVEDTPLLARWNRMDLSDWP